MIMTNFPEMIAPQFNQKNVHRGEAHDEQQHTHYAPPSPHTALFFFSSSLSSFSTNLRASPLLLLLVRTNTQKQKYRRDSHTSRATFHYQKEKGHQWVSHHSAFISSHFSPRRTCSSLHLSRHGKFPFTYSLPSLSPSSISLDLRDSAQHRHFEGGPRFVVSKLCVWCQTKKNCEYMTDKDGLTFLSVATSLRSGLWCLARSSPPHPLWRARAVECWLVRAVEGKRHVIDWLRAR